MSAEKDGSTHSDPENSGSEKPVREKLQKASIDASSQKSAQAAAADKDASAPAAGETAASGTNGTKPHETAVPGRLEKKRSHEIMEGEDQAEDGAEEDTADSSSRHTRKRSRDNSTAGDAKTDKEQQKGLETKTEDTGVVPAADEKHAGLKRPSTPESKADDGADESALEALASPKTKKTRHNTSEDSATAESSDAKGTAPAASIPATSGFANTSATSPFGGLIGSKPADKENTQTSASAFSSSGFKALSDKPNGFGALGAAPLSGFGSGGSFSSGKSTSLNGSSAKENEPQTTSSTFGGALGQRSAFAAAPSTSGSGFGSGGSGFGKLGTTTGGFGSGFGGGGGGFGSLGGGGLSSFASGKPAAVLGASSKAARGFGAPANDDDEDNENDHEDDENDDVSGYKSPLSAGADKQDERFYAQDLETGEENEVTEYSCRAKLYNFGSNEAGKKEWRERGFGTLRLNVKKMDLKDTDATPQARLVMRAEGSHRVVLNTPVQKELKFGDPKGGPPQGAYMFLMGVVLGEGSTGGGLELLQLKMRAQYTMELYEHIVKLQDAM